MRHESEFRVEAVSLVRLAGLAGGTRLATPSGDAPIERLVRGDRVLTRQGALRVIVAETRAARVAPIRIAAEAMGIAMPGRDLLVGPATRVWLPRQSKPTEARRLVDGFYVVEEEPRPMLFWTVVFVGPQVVRAEGVEVCV